MRFILVRAKHGVTPKTEPVPRREAPTRAKTTPARAASQAVGQREMPMGGAASPSGSSGIQVSAPARPQADDGPLLSRDR